MTYGKTDSRRVALPGRLTYKLVVAEDGTVTEGIATSYNTRFLHILICGTILTFSIARTLLFRLVDDYAPNGTPHFAFTWYFAAVIVPLGFIAIMLAVISVKKYLLHSKRYFFYTTSYPNRSLIAMGVLDGLYSMLYTCALPHIPNANLKNSLNCILLPLNMIGSRLILSRSYSVAHYVGASLAILACALSVVFSNDSNTVEHEQIPYVVMVIASYIPCSYSWILKERCLKESRTDPWYLNLWVAIYQLVFTVAAFFWVPMLKSYSGGGYSLAKYGDYLKDANECFFGRLAREREDCESHDALLRIYVCYILLYTFYNQCSLEILRSGSAVLLVMVIAVW
jgi:hypothetical protein